MSEQEQSSNQHLRREILSRLRFPTFQHSHPPVQNANELHENELSRVDRLALWITNRVGSMMFFGMIFSWTISWVGYNILATQVPTLHWKSFDPFPAFVAYLLISNVIQILLMPLIMVGQNAQSRHSEIRSELDFQINQKSEKEIAVILMHLQHNTELLLHTMKHLEVELTVQELQKIADEIQPSIIDPPINA
ncbi:MAG: DUF1003 domain-containing protein [Armatimonadota bacterium]